jgi:hypothetical protein
MMTQATGDRDNRKTETTKKLVVAIMMVLKPG